MTGSLHTLVYHCATPSYMTPGGSWGPKDGSYKGGHIALPCLRRADAWVQRAAWTSGSGTANRTSTTRPGLHCTNNFFSARRAHLRQVFFGCFLPRYPVCVLIGAQTHSRHSPHFLSGWGIGSVRIPDPHVHITYFHPHFRRLTFCVIPLVNIILSVFLAQVHYLLPSITQEDSCVILMSRSVIFRIEKKTPHEGLHIVEENCVF